MNAIRRHDLAFLRPSGWRAVLHAHPDLAAEPLVARWADAEWPLVGRRPMPGEASGIALGLPLPPYAGKRRLAFLVQREDVRASAPPPSLSEALDSAPAGWRPSLARLGELASRHAADARVFGSLAWRTLTGLDYLTDASDLDLLLYVSRNTDVNRLVSGLAAIEARAPMRLDGELIRDDGAAVNWRELMTGARDVLLKTATGVGLVEARRFLPGPKVA